MKLVYQYFGNGIALGIYGNREEIKNLGNYLFNHGATEGLTHFVSDTFGYVLTDKKMLLRGIANGAVTEDRMTRAKFARGSKMRPAPEKDLWPACLLSGQNFLDVLEREDFLEQETVGHVYKDPSSKNGNH